jgi:tetratricopeptide (TPR) repeat protein
MFIKKNRTLYFTCFFVVNFSFSQFKEDSLKISNEKLDSIDYHEEVNLYTKEIEKDSIKTHAFFMRGRAKFFLEDYSGAIQDLTKSIEIFSKDEDAYYLRGSAKLSLDDYVGAIQDFTKTLEIDTNYINAYYNRGIAEYYLKYYDTAILDFTKEIALKPHIGLNVARIYSIKFKKYKYYKQAFPRYASSYFWRGSAKSFLNDYFGAIQDFSKSIEKNSSNIGAYFKRGVNKYLLKNYIESISDFNRVIELSPTFKESYYYRGMAKIFLNNKSGGCSDLVKSGELGYQKAYDDIKLLCK